MPDKLRPFQFFRGTRPLFPLRLTPAPVIIAAAVLICALGALMWLSARPAPEGNPPRDAASGTPAAEPAGPQTMVPPESMPPGPPQSQLPAADSPPGFPRSSPATPTISPSVSAAGAVTRPFGWHEHPVFGDWRLHTGVDIAVADGSPVKAIWGGRVGQVYNDPYLGLTVSVENGELTVYYASLSASRCAPGDPVAAGTVIGFAGRAPAEPEPHLHLALRRNGRLVDPAPLLP